MLGTILGAIPGATKLATGVGNMILKGKEMKHGNKEKREQRRADAQANALAQFKGEFVKPENWFDSFINGANRTPRPVIANGTIGLFIYAFIDPVGFSETMEALELVPEPLWWLLSSIVVFYFGARELSYSREHKVLVHKLNNRAQSNETDEDYGDEDGMATRIVGDKAEKLDRMKKIMDDTKKRER